MKQKYYNRGKILIQAGVRAIAVSCWQDIKQAVKLAEKWLKRQIRRTLRYLVKMILAYLHRPWWVATTIMVAIILIQQYYIIQSRVQVNNDSHEMMLMQEQIDSANMTNIKYIKYHKDERL